MSLSRRKGHWIDDKAEDQEADTEPEEEDSDFDDLSVTTEVAAAEDEEFIVEVVKRRFGLVELNSGAGVQANQLISAQSTSLVGLREQCGQRYNSDCSKPRVQSGDPVSGVQLGDVKSSVVIGSGYSGPSTTPSGTRRKKLLKTAQQSVVSSSISERANSLSKAKVHTNSPQAVSSNAVQTGVQATAMDVEKTSAL